MAWSSRYSDIASCLVESRLVEHSAQDFSSLTQSSKPADVLPMPDSILRTDMLINLDKAADNGHAHVLEFLHKHRTEGFTEAMFRRAVDCDQRAAVRWVLENIDQQQLDLNRAMRSALSLQLFDMCDILEAYAQSRHIKLSVKRHRD
ncbi:hypothetical protein HK105_205924 [Polyrhizophydium stewartii]|uniref:Uncharacterized protein n=1 Tax=Polyrhizophydium stewartii TaxID=2732419 RepID=A0ABR4N4V1_9FUNG|nr:hypothetical protein HK105_001507 [Polyrhizophydium stewartii]